MDKNSRLGSLEEGYDVVPTLKEGTQRQDGGFEAGCGEVCVGFVPLYYTLDSTNIRNGTGIRHDMNQEREHKK